MDPMGMGILCCFFFFGCFFTWHSVLVPSFGALLENEVGNLDWKKIWTTKTGLKSPIFVVLSCFFQCSSKCYIILVKLVYRLYLIKEKWSINSPSLNQESPFFAHHKHFPAISTEFLRYPWTSPRAGSIGIFRPSKRIQWWHPRDLVIMAECQPTLPLP